MRLRRMCTLVAFCVALWTSGCCWDRCCCRRHFFERDCGCGCPCESSCYAPAPCGCGAPPLAAPVGPPIMPPPTPLMPGGGR
jgi:hypothetical protein